MFRALTTEQPYTLEDLRADLSQVITEAQTAGLTLERLEEALNYTLHVGIEALQKQGK